MKPALLRCAFAVLAGCGSVTPIQPDARSIDADLRDADLSANVTVITQAHVNGVGAMTGAPIGMVDIFATLPNRSMGDMIQTDASGHGTIKVYPGGSVTAIYHHTADMGADLITYFGVKPGDTLTFGREVTAPNTNIGTMTYSWPAFAGASNYLVYTSCTQAFTAATSVVLNHYDGCNQAPMDVTVIARNASNIAIGSSTSSVTFASGGSATLTALTASTTGTVSVTGLPPEVTNSHAVLYNVVNNGGFGFSAGSSYQQPTGGAVTLMLPQWAAAGTRSYGELSLIRAGGFVQTKIVETFPLSQTTWTVPSPTVTSWLGDNYNASLALRTMVWYPFGTATHDGTTALAAWYHTINTVNSPFSWSFIAPPTTTSFTMPTLPTAFAELGPHPEDYLNQIGVRLIDFSTVSGYDAFRAIPERQMFCPECAVKTNVFPRAVITQ